MGPEEIQIAKWVVDQGGVFAILIVILFFYRRDFNDVRTNLSRLVEQNIAAMQDMKATGERVADALDHQNLRHRQFDDPPPRRTRGDR